MNPIISTTNLSKKYAKEWNVNHLCLTVPTGCVYGFLGPNGAGKTTTMKMLLGLIKPTDGSMKILGQTQNYKNRISILKQIGSLIESPSYYGHLSAQENLELFSSLKQANPKQIDSILDMVHLKDVRDKKTKNFSLGMKQRLGIAIALLGNPKLILLDEPTNGLDPSGILEIRDLISSLPEKYGITVLVSSHLLSEIDQMATEIGIIDHGNLVFQDSLHVLHKFSEDKIKLKTLEAQKTRSLLQKASILAQEKNGCFILPKLSDSDLSQLLRLLILNDVSILRVEEIKKTLEEIFLDLTTHKEATIC